MTRLPIDVPDKPLQTGPRPATYRFSRSARSDSSAAEAEVASSITVIAATPLFELNSVASSLPSLSGSAFLNNFSTKAKYPSLDNEPGAANPSARRTTSKAPLRRPPSLQLLPSR